MSFKVVVPYEHDSADLRPIFLALSRREPLEREWRPALRDTIRGQLVVWARFDTPPASRGAEVWVRDSAGARQISTFTG